MFDQLLSHATANPDAAGLFGMMLAGLIYGLYKLAARRKEARRDRPRRR